MELNIANEIALMVCKSCVKNDTESEIDYSTRLYETFCKCRDNIQDIIDTENGKQVSEGLDFLKGMSF